MAGKIVIADSINLAIVILMLIVMLFVTYKIYKYTELNDKVLFFMIFFLDLTLICKYCLS